MADQISSPTRDQILRQVVEGGKIAGPIGGLFGFVADVLTPLAPLNGLLFLASLLFCAVMGYRCRLEWRRGTLNLDRRVPEQALTFGLFLLLGFGIWLVFQLAAGSDGRGALASNVQALARLQDAVFGLQLEVAEVKQGVVEVRKDTEAIRKDTGVMKQDTAKVAENTAAVAESTAIIAQDTGEIRQQLSRVGEGGIINNPDSPADYYHNAKFYELEGRYRQAFDAYERYVEFDQEFVDPYLAYLDLLRTQRGQPAARVEFDRLLAKFPDNRALALVSLALLSGQRKTAALEQFIGRYPDFGPGYLFGANAYSAAEMAVQSKVAAEKERGYLQAFITMNDSGSVLPYYLDKRMAIELVSDSKERINVGGNTGAQFAVSVMTESMAQFAINDLHVKQVLFSFDGEDWHEVPSKSLHPMQTPLGAITIFTLPKEVIVQHRAERLAEDPKATTSLHVKYIDTDSRESPVVTSGPYRLQQLGKLYIELDGINRSFRNIGGKIGVDKRKEKEVDEAVETER